MASDRGDGRRADYPSDPLDAPRQSSAASSLYASAAAKTSHSRSTCQGGPPVCASSKERSICTSSTTELRSWGEIASRAERDDHIEQDICATQAPQNEGGGAHKESGGPCHSEQSVRR